MTDPPRALRGPSSYQRLVPTGAHVERSSAHGATTLRFFLDGQLALVVGLDEEERPFHAMQYDASGRAHGLEREWHPSGRLRYEARYRQGLQHGLQRQWDARGRLLVRTRFVAGTGLDLYCGDPDSPRITESRELVAGERHGFERRWSEGKLFAEQHFQHGLEHGISRRWTLSGRLERGHPRYFVRGERVDRRAYVRACASDETLPVLREREDRPARARPVGVATRSTRRA